MVPGLDERGWSVRRWAGVARAAALAAVFCVGLVACERKQATYRQDTPDDVIQSAVEMVKNGDTRRLGDLIYADSPEMRVFLTRLGDLFGHMQKLAGAAGKKFPDELVALKAKAAQAAAEGKADPLLSAVSAMGSGRRGGAALGGRGGRGSMDMDEGTAQDLINRLFADPYGWIETNATRLSALKTSDDTASVMLDNKPIIPLVGLPMRRAGDKWYIALPTTFPGISDVMPRSHDQWRILVSIVKVLDRTVVEMTDDVEQGRVATLDSLGQKAREKAVLPGVMAFMAYGKEMEVHKRVDRRMAQFRDRQKEWVKYKAGNDGDDAVDAVSPKLLSVVSRLAGEHMEPLVRKHKAPRFDNMSNAAFESLVGGWLSEAGLNVKLDGDLRAMVIDAQVDQWTAADKSGGLRR